MTNKIRFLFGPFQQIFDAKIAANSGHISGAEFIHRKNALLDAINWLSVDNDAQTMLTEATRLHQINAIHNDDLADIHAAVGDARFGQIAKTQTCPDCDYSAPKGAPTCPECGCPLNDPPAPLFVPKPLPTLQANTDGWWARTLQRTDVQVGGGMLFLLGIGAIIANVLLASNKEVVQPVPEVAQTPPPKAIVGADKPLAELFPQTPSVAPTAFVPEKSAAQIFFEAICGVGNATEESCLKCPDYTTLAGETGPWTAARSIGVRLSGAEKKDRIATMSGCETGGYDSSVLLVRVGETGWKQAAFLSLVDVNNCSTIPRGPGLETLVCHATEVGQGDASTTVVAISVVDGSATVKVVATTADNSAACSQDYVSETVTTRADDPNRDGIADLLVTVKSVKTRIPDQYEDPCDAIDQGFQLPPPTTTTTRFKWTGAAYR